MSNPCINRWGINTFWHHTWYSDTSYSLNLRHDKLILELLQTFLTYGTNPNAKLFWSPYWYKTGSKPTVPGLHSYYRWLTLHSRTVNTTTTYRMRIPSEEIFQTRISVLKFNSWFIVNFYWFQPDKDKNKRARRAKTKERTTSSRAVYRSLTPLTKLGNLLSRPNLATSLTETNYLF